MYLLKEVGMYLLQSDYNGALRIALCVALYIGLYVRPSLIEVVWASDLDSGIIAYVECYDGKSIHLGMYIGRRDSIL